MCASSQRNYTVALLDRYRKALETAVQISCRYNVPPLPGRTLILLSTDIFNDGPCSQKHDFCLPPDPEEQGDDEKEEETLKRRRGNVEEDDKLAPSVSPFYLFIFSEKVWRMKNVFMYPHS